MISEFIMNRIIEFVGFRLLNSEIGNDLRKSERKF